jgi:hypothetical protein
MKNINYIVRKCAFYFVINLIGLLKLFILQYHYDCISNNVICVQKVQRKILLSLFKKTFQIAKKKIIYFFFIDHPYLVFILYKEKCNLVTKILIFQNHYKMLYHFLLVRKELQIYMILIYQVSAYFISRQSRFSRLSSTVLAIFHFYLALSTCSKKS